MKLRQDFVGGKMNQDLDKRLIPKGEYRQLTNGRTVGSYGDNAGVVEQARGNELITAIPAIPSNFEVIGFCAHNEYLYYIATNLFSGKTIINGDGTIIGRYNTENNSHEFVLRDIKTSTRALVLVLDKNVLINSIDIFEGLLIFCDDNTHDPYKINIERSVADSDYYGNTDDVKLIKAPPTEPSIVGRIDTSIPTNFLKGEPLQFAIRNTYEDGEVSAISPYSGVSVQIEDAGQQLIDGNIAYVGYSAVTGTGSFRILRTDNNFGSFSIHSFPYTPQNRDKITSISIDASGDGSLVVMQSQQYTMIIDFSIPASPELVRLFDGRDFAPRGASLFGRWRGCHVSRDSGQIILQMGSDNQNNDEAEEQITILKVSTPINSSSTLNEVYQDNDPGDRVATRPGKRMCASSSGNIVYVGASRFIDVSMNFGESGSWSRSANLNDLFGSNKEVISMCCSEDGTTAYCLSKETYGTGDEAYVFKTSDSGASWTQIYGDEDTTINVANIDCSANGEVVCFVSDHIATGVETKIFVTRNGSSFIERTSGFGALSLDDVTVSTTGKNITVATSTPSVGGISLLVSNDFGATFRQQTTASGFGVFPADIPVITSVNNEVEVLGASGLNNIDNIANRVDITYNTGNKHVTDIELIVRVVKTNNFFRIKSFNKDVLGLPDNIERTFSFRNDGSYVAIAEKDTNKLFDNVPLRAKGFTITQSALIFGNYTDGRSLINPDGSRITPNVLITITESALSETETNASLKTGSNNEYGLVYYDTFNRSSTVLSLGDISIPEAGSDMSRALKSVRITIKHLAPEWATKYKIVRKPAILNYNIINGFDSARVVNGEVYLEITSYVSVVPRENDILELFSELNTSSGGDPYLLSQGKLTVPILRYVDQSQTGSQETSVELSTGETTARVDSESDNTTIPLPRGRYIAIAPSDLDNYTIDNIRSEDNGYLSNLFYIKRNANIEDVLGFQEIPGEYEIDEGFHLSNDEAVGNSDNQDQDADRDAILHLDFDYDVVWGTLPIREMYKYDDTTNISNLGRPNFVSENAREEKRFASLIASEVFVDDTNVNGLSSFNSSLIPFKDLDKRDGEIELIESEDTNVEVYQRNKISRVFYKKNILTTAIGEQSVTQSPNIWGEQVRSIDEYGLTHPESFAQWGGLRYYVDAKRGVIIRKGNDGQTEISAYGFLDFFHRLLTENSNRRILGYYEPKYNNYCVVVSGPNAYHGEFAERSNGWELDFNWIPEKVTNDGANAYSYKDQRFYKHDANEMRGNFYGEDEDLVLRFFFNDANDVVKTITAISINGSLPNAVTIKTENQMGILNGESFEEIEGLLFSDAPKDQLDSGRDVNFAGIVGRDNTGATIPMSSIDGTYIHIGDVILKNSEPLLTLGNCIDIGNDFVTIDASVTVSEGDLILARESTPINGDILKGRVIEVEVRYSASSEIKLLNSIELEVDESKQ